jgi:hypothetical protein
MPVTDETRTPDGGGRFNHFQGGSIYWSPQTGAHEVHGVLRDKWAALGWEHSILGYPVEEASRSADGRGTSQQFQHGSLTWPDGTPPDAVQVSVRPVRLQIILDRLVCSSTTEPFHDEFYYVIAGRDGDGQAVTKRGPSADEGADADDQTAWDMNDSGDKQDRRLDAVLYDGTLGDGQTATLDFGFLESDSWSIGEILGALVKYAGGIPLIPVPSWVGGLVEKLAGFIPRNDDDRLGEFQIQASSQGGRLVVGLSPGQYTTTVQAWDQPTWTFAYRFRHDDGDYTAYFRVRLV